MPLSGRKLKGHKRKQKDRSSDLDSSSTGDNKNNKSTTTVSNKASIDKLSVSSDVFYNDLETRFADMSMFNQPHNITMQPQGQPTYDGHVINSVPGMPVSNAPWMPMSNLIMQKQIK